MIAWLRRADPGLRVFRRGARVTLVACLVFYVGRYGLGNPVLATYGLFGAVAMGGLSQIPGSPTQRARTLMGTLPVAWVLVTLGTLLAVWDVAAALGMFVLGFAVTYAGVGGPRLVGVVNGLQLLYILPCFPPFAPHTLSTRLVAVSVAIVLLAVAELVLWPDPVPPSYEMILAEAVASLTTSIEAAADTLAGDPNARGRLAASLPDAVRNSDALRPSLLDPGQRPASASKRDQALSQAGSVTRYSVARVSDLFEADGTEQLRAPAGAVLLRESAVATQAIAGWLRSENEPPELGPLRQAQTEYRNVRRETNPNGHHPNQLRLSSTALGISDGIAVLIAAARVAARVPIGGDRPVDPAPIEHLPTNVQPGPYGLAAATDWQLWWRRIRAHFTTRSVYFQGALRLAFALSVARLLAGVFDLSHGFWVLLAILTLLRTSAAQTRMASWPILGGTAIGAVIAGGLLLVVAEPRIFAIVMPILMFIGFSFGPLLGQLGGQAIFTVVISFIFAQLAPAGWRLAEARLVDVAIGVSIGVLIGLFAWPRGGSGELHRSIGLFLSECAASIRQTVAVLAGSDGPPPALPRARLDSQLAEASYALFQSERRGTQAARVDWQAALVAGHHAVRGAETLLRTIPSGRLIPCVTPLRTMSDTVAEGYAQVSSKMVDHRPVGSAKVSIEDDQWPTDLGPVLYDLADMRVWLEGLADDLGRILPTPSAEPTLART